MSQKRTEQLMRLMGSDNDNEALLALRALQRLKTKNGRTWADFVADLARDNFGATPPRVYPQRHHAPPRDTYRPAPPEPPKTDEQKRADDAWDARRREEDRRQAKRSEESFRRHMQDRGFAKMFRGG